MTAAEFSHSTDVEVRLRDTDALGHVNNAVYLTYLEVGRQSYWNRVAPDIRYDAVPFVLAQCTISFRSPSYTDEVLNVASRTAWISSSSFAMASEIRERESGRLVVEATSILVTYDYAEKRAMPVPDWLRAALERVEGGPLPGRPR